MCTPLRAWLDLLLASFFVYLRSSLFAAFACDHASRELLTLPRNIWAATKRVRKRSGFEERLANQNDSHAAACAWRSWDGTCTPSMPRCSCSIVMSSSHGARPAAVGITMLHKCGFTDSELTRFVYRPSEEPFWWPESGVFGPRDPVGKGTWIGLSSHTGNFAFLTNFREQNVRPQNVLGGLDAIGCCQYDQTHETPATESQTYAM